VQARERRDTFRNRATQIHGNDPPTYVRLQVQEAPVSPASSSLSNQNQNESEQQVLLATMQPVNVLDLHEPPAVHTLHPKYHHHHHRHHHHHHQHHHHQQQQQAHIQPGDADDVQQRAAAVDDPDGRVTPGAEAAGAGGAALGVGEHKMIDLIYNDGQKTVMYTHDKEIIYENEADRVQVVEYPPPPPSPPSPSPPTASAVARSAGLLPPSCVTSRTASAAATALHLHHYPQLQLQHEDDLPPTVRHAVSVPNCGAATTTTTVLVLSELVAADPAAAGAAAAAQQLTLTAAAAAASLRAG